MNRMAPPRLAKSMFRFPMARPVTSRDKKNRLRAKLAVLKIRAVLLVIICSPLSGAGSVLIGCCFIVGVSTFTSSIVFLIYLIHKKSLNKLVSCYF